MADSDWLFYGCPPKDLIEARCAAAKASLHERMTMLPGRVAVVKPAVKSRGSILMPESGRLGTDLGVVVHSGVPELSPGQFVGVRPYEGMLIEGYLGTDLDAQFVGYGGDTFKDVMFTLEFIGDRWHLEPTPGWMIGERVSSKLSDVILTPDEGRSAHLSAFKVISEVPHAPHLAPGTVVASDGFDWFETTFMEPYGYDKRILARDGR